MSTFQNIIKFFNSKKSNKVFTRKEYMDYMKYQADSTFVKGWVKPEYLDTVRRYLCAAGFLDNSERGVYRKLKPIPKDLTINKLERLAYPKAKRFQ